MGDLSRMFTRLRRGKANAPTGYRGRVYPEFGRQSALHRLSIGVSLPMEAGPFLPSPQYQPGAYSHAFLGAPLTLAVSVQPLPLRITPCGLERMGKKSASPMAPHLTNPFLPQEGRTDSTRNPRRSQHYKQGGMRSCPRHGLEI